MGKIAVSVPTLTGRLLVDCVRSIYEQKAVEPDLLLVSNSPQAEQKCDACRISWPGFEIARTRENIGVAASWNLACQWAWQRGHGCVVLLNDDIRLTDPMTLKAFEDAAKEDPLRLICTGHGFSAFCWTRAMWDALGPFDDGFWPAYYEDKDIIRRMHLKGIAGFQIPNVCHHEGSDTIHQGGDDSIRNLHLRAFPTNEARYVRKWGGVLGKETFTVPWNGRRPLQSTKVLISRGC